VEHKARLRRDWSVAVVLGGVRDPGATGEATSGWWFCWKWHGTVGTLSVNWTGLSAAHGDEDISRFGTTHLLAFTNIAWSLVPASRPLCVSLSGAGGGGVWWPFSYLIAVPGWTGFLSGVTW